MQIAGCLVAGAFTFLILGAAGPVAYIGLGVWVAIALLTMFAFREPY